MKANDGQPRGAKRARLGHAPVLDLAARQARSVRAAAARESRR
jgi:hypothetical protein